MNILQKLAHWWRGKRPLPKATSQFEEWPPIQHYQIPMMRALIKEKFERHVDICAPTLSCTPGLCQGRATCADLQCPGHPSPDADKHCPLSVAVRPKACPRRGIVSYLPRRPLP
jgi:hypothetical protein